MKVKVLQEVVNKRYYVDIAFDRGIIWWGSTEITYTNYKIMIDKDSKYKKTIKYELIDRECIDEFERYDMNYKVGDHMWYDNTEYTIKEVVDSGSEGIRIYLNKQRVVKEIGKEETEKLLKDIKIYQDELNEEYKEKIKTLNDEKIIKKDNNKSVIQKIKNYCIFKLGGSVNEG
ncbi:hypothetical protein [Clostridium perfringens]|jgi:hypothetical protein|uniref:Uncharacterized protein n=1 Tax=Clostridium perfringens TaxID=1502 RepID=A0AAW4IY09_CLOPF|nr:hypothetical protein [Clostridium perfringens]MBO3356148.1 hypothetical protein [Clostridium perfringens]MBO3359511.1 hypothetical protein [Clostridium perfringens]